MKQAQNQTNRKLETRTEGLALRIMSLENRGIDGSSFSEADTYKTMENSAHSDDFNESRNFFILAPCSATKASVRDLLSSKMRVDEEILEDIMVLKSFLDFIQLSLFF